MDLDLLDLGRLAILPVRAGDLLRACGLLGWLALHRADDLFGRALDLVFEGGLSVVGGGRGALLGHSARGGFALGGGALLGAARGGLAFADRFGRDWGEDARLRVAGCATGLGHCFSDWEGWDRFGGGSRKGWKIKWEDG